MKNKTNVIVLYAIIVLAGIFRFFFINWDNNSHMHPDERAIILAVLQLVFPTSLEEFFNASGSWNPQFFAYGSFPFYLLRLIGYLNPSLFSYDVITLVGRIISGLFDLGTVFTLFLIGKQIKDTTLGLIAAFFYAISVLPIQLSHFYAVDTPLTFFITLALYAALLFFHKPSFSKTLLMGTSLGFAMATKISAVVLVIPFMLAMSSPLLQHVLSKTGKHQSFHRSAFLTIRTVVLFGPVVLISSFLIFAVLEPYALLDFSTFWRQTLEQQAMTKDAFTFPYTLQYVGKIPYLYELRNIFFYGLGVPLSIICFTGLFYSLASIFRKEVMRERGKKIILLSFLISYFLIVGNFAIGFMRYMLPLYPLFCLFGALLTYQVGQFLKSKLNSPLFIVSFSLFALVLLIWPVSFMQIYTRPNTRIQATDWIHRSIPQGSTLAIEHWDDAVPINGQDGYTVLTLPLYDPDNSEKWIYIETLLQQTDYIILASNRLYTPLQKLTACDKLPPGKCYPISAKYYQQLFSGKLGFEKVAEFTSYPTVPILNLPIPDQTADESFTVYDHPKVMIFKKVETLPANLLTM